MRSLLSVPEVNGEIFYYKRILENPYEVLDLIESTNSEISELDIISKWSSWTSSSNSIEFGYTKNIDISKMYTTSYKTKYLYGRIISAIRIASENYSRLNNIKLGNQSSLSISKYSQGKFMGPHTDEKTGAHVSGVLYINDNYIGGEISFPDKDIKIKPLSGSMIIFPSKELHSPSPAYGGDRVICPVFWYI